MNIEQAIQISLVDYLASLGHRPVRIRGFQYWYISPFRNESEPSFKVNMARNQWYDFGEGMGGGIIALAKRLFQTKDISDILRRIQNLSGIPDIKMTVRTDKPSQKEEPAMKNVTTHPLSHNALASYLGKRGISLDIGRTFCGEMHYEVRGKKYFALAFPNNSGGYELRNPYFKGCFGRKDITLIKDDGCKSDYCHVFEGVFDLFSFITLTQSKAEPFSCFKGKGNFIVLNSVNNIGKAVEHLDKYRHIYMWLDNDTAGEKAAETIEGMFGYAALDMSFLYDGYNDLNDFLCNKKQPSTKD